MSTVKVIAIEPCNQHRPGDRFETSEHEARELVAAGLVKMALAPANKMMPDPINKAHPSPAAGEAQMSSALPAAQVLPQTTAAPSKTGARRGRPPGSGRRGKSSR